MKTGLTAYHPIHPDKRTRTLNEKKKTKKKKNNNKTEESFIRGRIE